jgi:AraC-like DNA-binding protein
MATSREPSRRALEDVERAHLVDPADRTFTIDRYPVAEDLASLARRFWVPVWAVPPGEESPQQVLQYPVCLLIVTDAYARFYGVVSGLSSTTLEGRGWGVGLMFQPAAGHLLTGRPVRELTDRSIGLAEVTGLDGAKIVGGIREAMAADPSDPARHRQARSVVEAGLRHHVPIDDEGRLVNEIVDHVEGSPELLRVDELCERFAIAERTLQRLLHKRIGLSPKWLIRRRRLQEAAERLRDAGAGLSGIATDLGYADQAHFTRDWRRATGLTPSQFAARFR